MFQLDRPKACSPYLYPKSNVRCSHDTVALHQRGKNCVKEERARTCPRGLHGALQALIWCKGWRSWGEGREIALEGAEASLNLLPLTP